mmetsp:Transcript_26723/g.58588  ORF Transcript_26723/g.58588 Transcript_26723/m.58588 type:complete len:260 (+) Transcript_26723:182-961(+)
MRFPAIFLLLSAAFALSASAFAFQQQRPSAVSASRSPLYITTPVSSKIKSNIYSKNDLSPLFVSAHFASGDQGTQSDEATIATFAHILRNRLRKATGFSLTVFRRTLRGITGISLTTLYAGTLAATGLWIRKIMSMVLSIFPSSFRYFMQPFLVLYYTPLILLRTLTSPTNRKRALAKHETVVQAYKEAVTLAEETEKKGYWPVVVSDDGYFELTKPPSVGDADGNGGDNDKMAEAMAEAVELAMKAKSMLSKDDEERK